MSGPLSPKLLVKKRVLILMPANGRQIRIVSLLIQPWDAFYRVILPLSNYHLFLAAFSVYFLVLTSSVIVVIPVKCKIICVHR